MRHRFVQVPGVQSRPGSRVSCRGNREHQIMIYFSGCKAAGTFRLPQIPPSSAWNNVSMFVVDLRYPVGDKREGYTYSHTPRRRRKHPVVIHSSGFISRRKYTQGTRAMANISSYLPTLRLPPQRVAPRYPVLQCVGLRPRSKSSKSLLNPVQSNVRGAMGLWRAD